MVIGEKLLVKSNLKLFLKSLLIAYLLDYTLHVLNEGKRKVTNELMI